MQSIVPETYLVVTSGSETKYDGDDGPDLFGDAVAVVIEDLFGLGKSEADVSVYGEFVKNYVAMKAATRVLPGLINFHMERSGKQDRVATLQAGAVLGVPAETRTEYDKVDALQAIMRQVQSQIAMDTARFNDLVTDDPAAGEQGAGVPGVSTWGESFRTQNPREMAPVTGWCGVDPTWP